MRAFKDLSTPKEIKAYLLNVLSRTGGKSKNAISLYHYTRFSSLVSILNDGFIWLGSTEKMNDYLEGEIISSVDSSNRLFYSCFSRVEENLAMYKMYAPSPDGAMMAIPFSVAQSIIDELPYKDDKKLLRVVRDNKLTEEEIEADVYWAAVVYKDLHTDLLKSETVFNSRIENPLNERELAGFIKLYGWEYEKEVRLCASTIVPLRSDERVAILLPKGIARKVSIVTVPEFDKTGHRKEIATLKRLGVSIHDSEYDALVDLGFSAPRSDALLMARLEEDNKRLREQLEELKTKLEDGSICSLVDLSQDGYHEVKNSKGKILKKGQFKSGKLVDGIEYNVIIRITKEEVGKDIPVPQDEIKLEQWRYEEYGQYDGYFTMMLAYDEIINEGLQFYYVTDKKVRLEGKTIIPTFSNFRTLESFLAKEEPDELEYIKTGNVLYEESDYADLEEYGES